METPKKKHAGGRPTKKQRLERAQAGQTEAAQMLARAVARAQIDMKLVAEHPWYAIKKGWILTEDEKPPVGVPAVRPFPCEEYLENVTELWVKSPMGLLAKSRQMMVSWLFAWLNLWDAAFHPARHCLFQGKRLDDVSAIGTKGILGRARFIRRHLPPFLQPDVVAETSTYEAYKNGSTLEAIPEGSDVIRGKVISSLFMDEICFQETSEANWNAAVPAAQNGGRLWGVSTPNGHEFLYRQAEMKRSWDNWRDWPKLMEGVQTYQNSRSMQLVALHYTANPYWRDVKWQNSIREGYTDVRAYMRERELDFSLASGLGVYANEFDKSKHVIEKYVPDPMLPMYRGWDPGYNGQAVSFWQFNHEGQLVWFDQIILKAVPLEKVAQEAKKRTLSYLGRPVHSFTFDLDATWSEAQLLDYGDPAARAHNADGESDLAILSKFGIHLRSKTTTGRKTDLVDNVRHLLLPRSDGKPGLLIAKNSPEMDHVIAGFTGGYHYAKPKENKAEKELPDKDGFYDHIFDSAQYAIDNISPIRYSAFNDTPDGFWWKDPEPGVGTEGYAA